MASITFTSSFKDYHTSMIADIDAVLRKCKDIQVSLEELASQQQIPVVMLCITHNGDILPTITLYLEEKIPTVLLERMRDMDGHSWLDVAFGDMDVEDRTTCQSLLNLAEIKIDLSKGIPPEYSLVMIKCYYC